MDSTKNHIQHNIVENTQDAHFKNRTTRILRVCVATTLALFLFCTLVLWMGLSRSQTAYAQSLLATNTAPSITPIADLATNEDTPTPPITFVISDVETPLASLLLTATNDNPTLVPPANMVLGGAGGNRSVVITPALNISGVVVISITVGDGLSETVEPFTLTVNAVNDAPTIAPITPVSTNEDTPTSLIAVTIGDVDTPSNTLTLNLNASNPSLVSSYVFGGSGLNRTLVVTPTSNASGSSVITLTVSDGTLTTNTAFTLTVNAVSDAPTIDPIGNVSTNEDTPTSVITVTIGDVDTPSNTLTLNLNASNPSLVGSYVFGGSGVNRTLVATPASNASGSSVITVTVSDGALTARTAFTLTVLSQNDAPTITVAPSLNTAEDVLTSTTVTVGDADGATNLTVTATSGDVTLLPNANIAFVPPNGASTNRTLTLTPAANKFGSVLVTLVVSDGISSSTTSTTLNVASVNDAPTITPDIQPQTITEDNSTNATAFTVDDLETPAASLNVTATTGNAAIVPLSGILIGGSGASRTVQVTPTPNANGAATISVTVSDGVSTTIDSFVLTINPVNDAPTISSIVSQTTNEDVAQGPLAFTVGDVDNAVGTLTLLAASSNTTLMPVGNIVFGGSGASRTVTLTPAANLSGAAIITITVSDGVSSTATSFTQTVLPVNDAPFINPVANQATNEDQNILVAFTIGDIDSTVDCTDATATVISSTPVPPNLISGVLVGGAGTACSVNISLIPNAFGSAQIRLRVTDDFVPPATVARIFTLTVNSVNDAPVIGAIADQTIAEDTSLSGLSFNVSDLDVPTQTQSLVLTATTSNASVVALSGISFSPATGSNGTRNINISPLPNANGVTSITVRLSDGISITTKSFLFTVTPVNDSPTLVSISNQNTPEDVPLSLTIVMSDVDDASLTPLAQSGNIVLVPNANMVFSGSGYTRTMTLTPAANQNGTSVITVTVLDPDGAAASTNFQLTVTPVNDAPFINPITDKTGNEDTVLGPFNITLGDIDSPLNTLVMTATSSDQAVVPTANISISGNNGNRSMTITPAPDQNGPTIITVYVSDGQLLSNRTFTLFINAVDDAPTISVIDDQTTDEDMPTGVITFTIDDIDDAINNLSITPGSSNTAFVPVSNMQFGGSGASRTLVITPSPNQFGVVIISITVRDAANKTAVSSFDLTINPINDPPTITPMTNKTMLEGTTLGPILFQVNDLETPQNSLSVSGVSSNQLLLPNSGLAFGTAGANRTLTITPAQFQSGSATITVTVSDPSGLFTQTKFLLTVTPVNDAPDISVISNQNINEDSVMGPVSFTIEDIDTPASALGITATSSNLTLVPLGAIKFDGNTMSRTITITPTANGFGSSSITVYVDDGLATTTRTFDLNVNSLNDAPRISPVSAQSTNEDTPLGPIPFTVSDVDSNVSALQLSVASSNPALIPVANITFGGGGGSRSVSLTPVANQNGTAIITVTVSDGSATDSSSFLFTVAPVNDTPTISTISDQTILEDSATPSIPFTVGDLESPAGSLQITVTTSNSTVVPLGNIVLGGSGANRTIKLTPLPDQNGVSNITVRVSDGTTTTVTGFQLTVNPVNDAPSINPIGGVTIRQDGFAVITFTVNDIDSPINTLIMSGESSNPSLMPTNDPARFYFTGNGITRTLTIVPTALQSGSGTITLTVVDGSASAKVSFPVVVTPVNYPPTISGIANQTINEDTVMGPIVFTVNDTELPVGSLGVTAVSSNGALVPVSNISINSFGGPTRTVVITPTANAWGFSVITLTVNDGLNFAETGFNLTVNAVDDLPSVTTIQPPTSTALFVGATTGDLPFSVGDLDTPLGNLVITATTSNGSIVRLQDIVFTGSGADRMVRITPMGGQTGDVEITVRVSDGTNTVTTTFKLSIRRRSFLPVMFNKYFLCSPLLTDCSEPNNTYSQAFGPLSPNTVYTGMVDTALDQFDIYSITLESGTEYTMTLNFVGVDMDLFLYRNAPAYTLATASNVNGTRIEQLVWRAEYTGLHFIRVYGFNTNGTPKPYTLEIKQSSSRFR